MGVTELAHVLVLSDDIDAARDFYCRAVGMTVGERPPLEFPGYWLYAEGKPCLHIADRAIYNAHAARAGLGAPDEQTRRVDHIANPLVRHEQRLPNRLHIRTNRCRDVVDVVRDARRVLRDRIDTALDVVEQPVEFRGRLAQPEHRRQ